VLFKTRNKIYLDHNGDFLGNTKLFVMLFLLYFIFYFQLHSDVITKSEREIIYNLLENNEFDSTSVNFLKDWSSDTEFKIPLVVDIINNPMLFPEFISHQEKVIETRDPDIINSEMSEILFGQRVNIQEYFKIEEIENPGDIFEYISTAWEIVENQYENSLSDLSEEEMDKLIYLSYMIPMENEDSLKYKNFFEKKLIAEFDLEIEEYIEIIEKINFREMLTAAEIFSRYFDHLVASVEELDFNNKKILKKKTRGILNSVSLDQSFRKFTEVLSNSLFSRRL